MADIYLKDSYIKEWETEVKEVKDDKFVILDQTAFYPLSGGQSYDTGIIKKDGEEYKVVYVGKFDGKVSHEVDRPGLRPGDKVKCILDWDRRYKLMRAHTAAHIICEVINKETGALITGNKLEPDRCRIDFNIDDYDPENVPRYIAKSNELVEKDLPISVEFVTREQAEKMPQLTKLAKGLPESVKEVRLLHIGDFDVQADGGTHVRSTKEVGKIELLKIENKGKNNRRLYFKLA